MARRERKHPRREHPAIWGEEIRRLRRALYARLEAHPAWATYHGTKAPIAPRVLRDPLAGHQWLIEHDPAYIVLGPTRWRRMFGIGWDRQYGAVPIYDSTEDLGASPELFDGLVCRCGQCRRRGQIRLQRVREGDDPE